MAAARESLARRERRASVIANATQIALWNTAVGERWVRLQAAMDAAYGEHGRRVLDAARLAPGEFILDLGCGTGAMALDAVGRVGPRGLVVGVDVSQPMLARARERAAEASHRRIRFERADVQTGVLGTAQFDAAVSRLGVMFFDDPVAAFTNVRGALRGGGRLGFVCWQSATDNPWISVPERATSEFLSLEQPAPDAPGPFSFADPARVRGILERAGFKGVHIDPLYIDITFGRHAGEAAALLLQFGLVGRALLSAEPAVKARALAAVEAALGPYTTRSGVVFPSRAWLVRAVRGG
jgi:SAM-dependent methyltransferase